MDNPQYVQHAWLGFAKAIDLDDASEVQRREMRRAFFAGGWSLLDMLMKLFDDTGNPDDVTEVDLKIMEWVSAELEQHQVDIQEGRA